MRFEVISLRSSRDVLSASELEWPWPFLWPWPFPYFALPEPALWAAAEVLVAPAAAGATQSASIATKSAMRKLKDIEPSSEG